MHEKRSFVEQSVRLIKLPDVAPSLQLIRSVEQQHQCLQHMIYQGRIRL